MDKELKTIEDTAVVAQGPMAMMQILMEKNIDIEKIEKMIEIQGKWEAIQAKKLFVKAMAKFKETAISITKDKTNKQYDSKYTGIGNLVNTVLPRMGECELSHNWKMEQAPELITVTCIVTHSAGHSESDTMTGPPDKSGAKNTIQQIKSTRTYLQAATFENVMGLASTDANVDDDGNGAAPEVKYISDKEKGVIRDMLLSISCNEQTFLGWLGCESIDTIDEKSYKRAVVNLKARIEEEKKNVNGDTN